MDIGIVGAGKVGCSIGKYLKENDKSVIGYFSRTIESAETAAAFTKTKAFCSLDELTAASDILFITTPDDEIQAIWNCIAQKPIQGKFICHFSGSLSSVVFSGMEETGAFGLSIHPMFAFSDKFTSYQKLNQVIFTMEGDERALAFMKPFFEKMGNTVCVIAQTDKVRYHAAASMVSNMMIGLYQMSISMLIHCGFDRKDAVKLVEPLVQANIQTLLASSPEEALTGPIERGDTQTVEKHLNVLKNDEKEVYVNLGRTLVEIARRKNPEKDYTAISECFRHEQQKQEV